MFAMKLKLTHKIQFFSVAGGRASTGGSVLQHVCGQVLGTSMHAVLSFLPRQDVGLCTRFNF